MVRQGGGWTGGGFKGGGQADGGIGGKGGGGNRGGALMMHTGPCGVMAHLERDRVWPSLMVHQVNKVLSRCAPGNCALLWVWLLSIPCP